LELATEFYPQRRVVWPTLLNTLEDFACKITFEQRHLLKSLFLFFMLKF